MILIIFNYIFVLKKVYFLFLIWFVSLFFGLPNYSYWSDDLTQSDFSLNPSTFSPSTSTLIWSSDMSWTVTEILIKVIDILIIAFWVLALLVMTIWAWYMIIYHGQEEFLSKWKTIFNAWLISLIIAFSAWMIISFINYLIYN